MDFLKSLKAPKVIKGQSGNYWRVANAEAFGRELFVRAKIEKIPVLRGATPVMVESVQINLMYMGDTVEWPAPFKQLDVRPYEVDGKVVPGSLVAKVWLPLGEFQKNMKAAMEAARDLASPVLMQSIAPAIDAMGGEVEMTIGQIFSQMLEELEGFDTFLCEPFAPLINEQINDYIANLQLQAKEKMIQMKASASQPKPPAPEGDAPAA